MSSSILMGFLGLALGLSACAPNTPAYADNQAPEVHQVKVLSGDRLVIDGESLTLADAQAPQPAPEAACPAEAAAAARAIGAARSALAGARHIEVQRTGAGNGLRLLNVDGLDVGQVLISQGVAVDRSQGPMDWCARAENQARLGLAKLGG